MLLKWLLFAVVLAYVCRHGYALWNQTQARQRPLAATSVAWLAAAGVAYLLSWLPSVWFWRTLMRAMGSRVSFRDAARAYYCGQLGKYIPGKAMVLVIRAALVKDRGCPPLAAAVTATYETLVMMGVGIALGGGLAPLLFPNWIASRRPAIALPPALEIAVTLILMAALVGASLPLVSRLLTWVAAKALRQSLVSVQQFVLPTRLLAAGCGAFVIAWTVQGLGLGMIVYAVGEAGFNVGGWPWWTGAVALSTSLGFLVLFAPGGLGVREGILLGILNAQPGVSPQTAVLVTVLARVVSFVAELVISGALLLALRKPGNVD